jgi:phosphoglycerate kinase
VGRSLLEADLVDTARRLLDQARARRVDFRLPVDTVVADSPDAKEGRVVESGAIPADLMGLDIGPASVRHFAEAVHDSRTIIWNGPMGVFERPPFAAGTLGLAQAVAAAPGLSVVGGGDTVAAVQAAGVADRIGYLSTGGGAFLEYLEGRTLPGVAALDDA